MVTRDGRSLVALDPKVKISRLSICGSDKATFVNRVPKSIPNIASIGGVRPSVPTRVALPAAFRGTAVGLLSEGRAILFASV